MNSVMLSAPAERVRTFFLNPDTVLRLNPAWHVGGLEHIEKGRYILKLYDDRTEENMQVNLRVDMRETAICYIMDSHIIEFLIDDIKPFQTRLSVTGDLFRKEDIPYWLRGIKNYIILEAKQSRIVKWLLDRLWLRMTPSQRRITIIVLLAEGIGLLALIGVMIALKIL